MWTFCEEIPTVKYVVSYGSAALFNIKLPNNFYILAHKLPLLSKVLFLGLLLTNRVCKLSVLTSVTFIVITSGFLDGFRIQLKYTCYSKLAIMHRAITDDCSTKSLLQHNRVPILSERFRISLCSYVLQENCFCKSYGHVS